MTLLIIAAITLGITYKSFGLPIAVVLLGVFLRGKKDDY
jgi:hypothetical protein